MKFESLGKQPRKEAGKDFDPSRRAFLKRSAEVGAAFGASAFAPSAVAEILLRETDEEGELEEEDNIESIEAINQFALEVNEFLSRYTPRDQREAYMLFYSYITDNMDLYKTLPPGLRYRIGRTFEIAKDLDFYMTNDETFMEADGKLMDSFMKRGYLFFSEGTLYRRTEDQGIPPLLLRSESTTKRLHDYPWIEEIFETLPGSTPMPTCYTDIEELGNLYGTQIEHFSYTVINKGTIERNERPEDLAAILTHVESNEAMHLLLDREFDFHTYDNNGNALRDFPDATNHQVHELMSDVGSILSSKKAARSFIESKIYQGNFAFEKETGKTVTKAEWYVTNYTYTINFLVGILQSLARHKESPALSDHLTELASITHKIDEIQKYDLLNQGLNNDLREAAYERINELETKKDNFATEIVAELTDDDINYIQEQYREKGKNFARKIKALHDAHKPEYQAGKK